MEENKARQIEEIEALSSIYEDALELETDSSYALRIHEESVKARLHIRLDEDYPGTSPPTYSLSAPSLSTAERRALCLQLDNIYLDNLGECIVFLWVEEVRSFLQNLRDTECEGEAEENLVEDICDNLNHQATISEVESPCPIIFTGECFEDRKSVFQGHVSVIKSPGDVKAALNKLYENKKIANASHNIYAFRISSDEKKTLLQDCEDDGETAAGGRLLHLLEILDLKNILVIVSRWYGGIHLGPDRFKHINNAARQVLEQSGLLVQDKTTKKKKK